MPMIVLSTNESTGQQQSGGGVSGMVTPLILRFISVLDDYGASTWNLRAVAFISAICLYGTYKVGRTGPGGAKLGNVCWEGLLHAIISGVGAAICVYLNEFAAEEISGVSEPLRSIRCDGEAGAGGGGPLTSLHRILPAITLGYGMCDILEGLDLGRDFLLHATALVLVMGTVCELGVSHTVTPMLIMELSSIWLNLVSASFISEAASVSFQALFALTFFVVRILIVPYIWLEWVITLLNEDRDGNDLCFPRYFIYLVLVFGVIFNGLNFYWMYKIIRKVRRKITGVEKMAEAELKDR
mmetsp:Transcript_2000/g.4249  ORF Transcript_2000/g.4249 Transcript_2000/m.4249 type:complete len:298 (-) Transcript_2000:106-999(-)